MKKIIFIFLSIILFNISAIAGEWKNKNKWKVSCGIVDKEALVVNGKSKKATTKMSLKLKI